MKVFISWSKPRSSAVAAALRDWLPNVIQSCEPWSATSDIDAGQRWGAAIEEQLTASAFGIICVTPENQAEMWLNFEAGALSKSVGAQNINRVAPYLLGMAVGDLRQPLAQFQAKTATEEGTFEVVKSINKIQAKPLDDAKLKKTFELWWPMLGSKLEALAKDAPAVPPKRSSDEKVDELLSLVRGISQRLGRTEPTELLAQWAGIPLEPSLQTDYQRELAKRIRLTEPVPSDWHLLRTAVSDRLREAPEKTKAALKDTESPPKPDKPEDE